MSRDNNWVSKILLFRMLATICLLLAVLLLTWHILLLHVIIIPLILLAIFVLIYFAYARYEFSPQGGDIQAKISQRVIDFIDQSESGQILDVGCGNGKLTVELAKKCPGIKIQAIDYWSGMWGYSKESCETTAKNENVSDRIIFTKASASALPFDDETFDAVISNMVFHEVADTKDKRDVIKEALRPLKKGGLFIFQDQFNTKRIYGTVEELLKYLKNLGINDVGFEDTRKASFIPVLLRNPIFVGDIGLIYGKK